MYRGIRRRRRGFDRERGQQVHRRGTRGGAQGDDGRGDVTVGGVQARRGGAGREEEGGLRAGAQTRG